MKFEKESDGYLLKIKSTRIKPRYGIIHTKEEPSQKVKDARKPKYEKQSILDQMEEYDQIMEDFE